MSSSKNFVFRLNYLLGVSVKSLKDDFSEDYKMSENLKLFGSYKDANKLRNLSMLRQCFLHTFSLFEENQGNLKNLCKLIPNLKVILEDLKKEDIDFVSIFDLVVKKKLSLFNVYNILNEMIRTITYKVLFDLEINYTDELMVYFDFPDVTSLADLENSIQEMDKIKNPYDLYIYNGIKIKNTLKYSLHSNENCVKSAYSMKNETFDGEVMASSFEFRKVLGEDLDDDAVIVQESIVDKFINSSVEDVVEEEPKKIIEKIREDNIVELPTDGNCFNVFVDCRNMGFFDVISFVNSLDRKVIKGITFVKNENTNDIWSLFDAFNFKKIPIKSIIVKQVMDRNYNGTVLASEITKNIYLNHISEVYILSNNPNISVIMSLLTDVTSYLVYSRNYVTHTYAEYLSKQKYNVIDMYDKEQEEAVLDKVMVYLILGRLKEMKISDWDVSVIADYIIDTMFIEVDMLNKVELKNKIIEIFNEVTTEIHDNKVYLRWKDITV